MENIENELEAIRKKGWNVRIEDSQIALIKGDNGIRANIFMGNQASDVFLVEGYGAQSTQEEE